MENKIKEIMATVFQVPVSEITEGTSNDTLPGWDSLQHLNLIVVLEETFGIEFSEEEMENLLSFANIREYIKMKV